MGLNLKEVFDVQGSWITKHLNVLIQTLASENALKTNQLRSAEKSLVFLEQIFSDDLLGVCQNWLEGVKHFRNLLDEQRKLKSQLLTKRAMQNRMKALKHELRHFQSYTKAEKLKLFNVYQQAQTLVSLLSSRPEFADRIQEFQKFLDLAPLHDCLDQAEEISHHMCDAKALCSAQKQLQNTQRDLDRKNEKIKEASQMIYLFGGLSIFIVTIPMTVPVLINALFRKKHLIEEERELKDLEESQSRLVQSGLKGLEFLEKVGQDLGISTLDELQDKIMHVAKLKKSYEHYPRVFQHHLRLYARVVDASSLFENLLPSLSHHPVERLVMIEKKLGLFFQKETQLKNFSDDYQSLESCSLKAEARLNEALAGLQEHLSIQDIENLDLQTEMIQKTFQIHEALQDCRKTLSAWGRAQQPTPFKIDLLFVLLSFNNQLKFYRVNTTLLNQEETSSHFALQEHAV
jgi:hypothetical protein